MKAGKNIGIVLLTLGIVLSLFFYFVASSWDAVPKILLSAPALVVAGIIFILFPGGEYYKEDLKNAKGSSGLKMLWKKAPLLHKFFWILSLVLGAFASIYFAKMIGFL